MSMRMTFGAFLRKITLSAPEDLLVWVCGVLLVCVFIIIIFGWLFFCRGQSAQKLWRLTLFYS